MKSREKLVDCTCKLARSRFDGHVVDVKRILTKQLVSRENKTLQTNIAKKQYTCRAMPSSDAWDMALSPITMICRHVRWKKPNKQNDLHASERLETHKVKVARNQSLHFMVLFGERGPSSRVFCPLQICCLNGLRSKMKTRDASNHWRESFRQSR